MVLFHTKAQIMLSSPRNIDLGRKKGTIWNRYRKQGSTVISIVLTLPTKETRSDAHLSRLFF